MKRILAHCILLALLASGAFHSADAAGGLAAPPRRGVSAARTLFEANRSGVWLTARGKVVRILKDDLKGRRHQRFIIRLFDGHTLLVAHNIDIAPRVPLDAAHEVAVRGLYEWNRKGGVLHWTHHDPRGRKRGGWIRHLGRRYD